MLRYHSRGPSTEKIPDVQEWAIVGQTPIEARKTTRKHKTMTSSEESRPFITLGDVLSQSYLGLNLVVGTKEDLDLPVTGAHAIEIPNPSRWVSPNWIALTTGLRLKAKAESQRELIVELKSSGITALGFGLDVSFRQIPSAMIDSARAQNFPIFTVPFSTGFAEVIAYVNQSLASPHLNALLRFVSMQDFLLSALSESNPLSAITTRMTQLLGLRVMIARPDGVITEPLEVVNSTLAVEVTESLQAQIAKEFPSISVGGDRHQKNRRDGRIPTTPRGREAPQCISTVVDFYSGQRSATAVSVGVMDQPLGWLIAIEEDPLPTSGLHLRLPILRSVAHLVGVTIGQRQATIAETEAKRRALLRDIAGDPATPLERTFEMSTTRARGIKERLFALGFETDQPYAALCLRVNDTTESIGENEALRPGAALSRALEELSIAYLTDRRRGEVHVVAQCSPKALGEVAAGLLASAKTAGVSSAKIGLSAMNTSLQEARYCAHLDLTDERQSDSVRFYEELGIVDIVLSKMPGEQLSRAKSATLKPIASQRNLVTSLKALLDADLDIAQAAESLGIHPNSLRYRIAKVEEELHISTHRLKDLVELYLALKDSPFS